MKETKPNKQAEWEGTETPEAKSNDIPELRPPDYMEATRTERDTLLKEIDNITGGNYSFHGLMYLAALYTGHYALLILPSRIPDYPDATGGEFGDMLRATRREVLEAICPDPKGQEAIYTLLAKHAPLITRMSYLLAPFEQVYVMTPFRPYITLKTTDDGDKQIEQREKLLNFDALFTDIEQQAQAIPPDILRQLVFDFVAFTLGNFTTDHVAQYEHIEAIRKLTMELLTTPSACQIRNEWDNYIFNAGFAVEEERPTPPLLWYLKNYKAAWEKAYPTINGYKPTERLCFSLDIVSNKAYYDNKPYFSGELTTLNMAGQKAKKAKEAILKLTTEEGITIQPRHILLQAALAGLKEANNNVVTLSQIAHVMYNTNNPSTNQLEAIDKMLQELRLTQIEFDNANEAKETKYPHFKYKGALVATEQVKAEIKGKWTDWAVRILAIPLYEFAKGRQQIEAFDPKLINIPDQSNTADTNSLKAYFLRQLFLDKPPANTTATGEATTTKSRKTHKGLMKVYSYNNAFGECGINGKQRTRLKPAIVKMFQHWTNEGLIEDFYTEGKPKGKTPTIQECKAIIVYFPEQA